MPAPGRIHTALRSVLDKYGHVTSTPHSSTEDDINACMSEILGLIEEDGDQSTPPFSIRHRAVQCSADEIQQEIWNALSAQQRLRLELAQTIAERLTSAALLAQSKANISVICLLLPGAAV
jgi:hypothetical protein